MNKKQEDILEKRKKELKNKKTEIIVLGIFFLIGLFIGWLFSIWVSIVSLIILIILGVQENNYKKEINDINYKLAEKG